MNHVTSNIAYAIGGLIALLHEAYLPGLGLIFLSWGSYMGHKYGKWSYDWAGMFVAFFAIIAYNFHLPLYFALPFTLAGLFLRKEYWVLLGATYIIAQIGANFFLPTLYLFALAGIIRVTIGADGHRYYDVGHSIWHYLTATAMTLMIL